MSNESLFTKRPNDSRIAARIPCSTGVKARLVRAGAPTKVSVGAEFETRSINVSNGGVLLRNPWPLNEGDVVALELKQLDGSIVTKHGEVVSVRLGIAGGHMAGLRFLSAEEVSALGAGPSPSSTSEPSPPPR